MNLKDRYYRIKGINFTRQLFTHSRVMGYFWFAPWFGVCASAAVHYFKKNPLESLETFTAFSVMTGIAVILGAVLFAREQISINLRTKNVVSWKGYHFWKIRKVVFYLEEFKWVVLEDLNPKVEKSRIVLKLEPKEKYLEPLILRTYARYKPALKKAELIEHYTGLKLVNRNPR